MKKNASLFLTRTLYILFITGTIILFFIIYKDIDSNAVFNFVKGYLFLTFFMLLYVPLITILNSKKIKSIEIRKRTFNFIALFIVTAAVNYIFDYLFRPASIDFLRILSISVGMAFGISFFELTFYKNEEK